MYYQLSHLDPVAQVHILHRNKVFGSKDKFSSKILLPIAQVNFNFLGIHTTQKLPLQQTKNPEWQVICKQDMNIESQKLRMTQWLIVNEHLMDCKEYDNNVCSSNIRRRYSSNILLFLLRILLEQTLCNVERRFALSICYITYFGLLIVCFMQGQNQLKSTQTLLKSNFFYLMN